MDWIDMKIETIRKKVQNSSLLKAAIWYLVFYAGGAAVLSVLTLRICRKWLHLWQIGEIQMSWLQIEALFFISQWCSFVYLALSILLMLHRFYKKRLKTPVKILQGGVREIQKQNLAFSLVYPCEDEMGCLCRSFEELRQNLVYQYEMMWKQVEEQKQLNAAFAHDLRTPLTVLKGYSELLMRYLPQGKISQKKSEEILKLMTKQLERLTSFSKTMKEVRNLDTYPVEREDIELIHLQQVITGILEALNLNGGVKLSIETGIQKEQRGLADEQVILEVLDNLLSNAIRFAYSEITVFLETEQQEDKEFLLLYVQDDGSGFTQNDLKKAIEPYYSAETEGEHFGIGLHICTMLCKAHQGAFSIANRMGKKGAIVSASFQIS